jgi:hypothetical protein
VVAVFAAGLLLATFVPIAAGPTPILPAEAQTVSTCDDATVTPVTFDPGTGLLLPPWADHAGWGNPSSYRTITTGDVDGDGIGELIGRNATTVETYTWSPGIPPPVPAGPGDSYIPGQEYNPTPGQWTQLIPGPGVPAADFAEINGWWDPSRYMTFNLANVDGQPGDELIARDSTGLEVRTWNKGTVNWNDPLPGGPPWTDAAGWTMDNPQYYRSIITGDLDGNGVDEIVANGPDGVEVWGAQSGSMVRLDAGPGDVDVAWSAGWNNTNYEILKLADINDDNADEFIVRDSLLGVRMFEFRDDGSGATWHEMAGSASGLLADVDLFGAGGGPEAYYYTFNAADLDGNGTKDIFIRLGQGLFAFTYNGSAWVALAAGGVAPSDINGWGPAQYSSTIQPAQVLPGVAEEVLGRAGGGLSTFYIVPSTLDQSIFPPFEWAQAPQNIAGFEDGPSSTSEAGPGFGPQPNTMTHIDNNSDVRYSTIQPATTVAGQPQLVIGKNHLGIVTYNLDGSSPTAPYAPYTNLQGLPTQFPTDGSAIDLSVLSPAGRAYWYLNASMGNAIWKDVPDWTLLDQFKNPNLGLPAVADLTPDSTGRVKYEPNDPTLQPDNPGWTASSSALNVSRETYGNVSQDLANWTAGVDDVRELIYGPTGLETLILDTFVANAGRVSDVKTAFESGNPKMRSITADLLWGVIGAIGALIAGPFEGMAAASINAIFGLVGAGAGAAFGARNPDGDTETFADDLQSKLVNTFCGANQFLDLSYTQITEDYGLLVSTSAMAELIMARAPAFATQTAQANQGQLTWIWQQFANRPPGDNVQNFWVGVCNEGDSCGHWSQTSTGVWVAPESSTHSFRIVGQSHNGSEANCSWAAQHEIVDSNDKGDSAKQAWIDAFGTGTTAPAGPNWASPRTTSGHAFGNFDDTIPNNIGILGWNLGTAKCN